MLQSNNFARVLVLVIVAFFATSRVHQAHATELWFGTMQIKDVRQFRFTLKLDREDGKWSGTLKSLDEGSRKFKMSKVAYGNGKFRFELTGTKAVYEGTVKESGKSIEGHWMQGGGKIDLDFTKVDREPARGIKEAWKGQINALVQKLDVAFVRLESGDLLFDSLSQKVGGFAAKDESKDGEVVFKVPAVRGTFKGKFNDDKSEIVGKWSQGLDPFSLVLKRVDKKELEPIRLSRPQTPKPPFPYEVRKVTFPSKADDVKLAGTLTIPKGKVNQGVVLISGSGPQDRDETLLEHKPFLVIADHFARNGIATLRYDDRGVAGSTGDHSKATSLDFADDAEGALEYLRALPNLKGARIGLCGHSEGGLIAPIVAARNPNVSFVVMMAGTGVNGEQILYSQSQLVLKAEGASGEEMKTQAKFQRALLSTVVTNIKDSNDELATKVTDAVKQAIGEEEFKERKMATMVKAGVAQVASPWFREFLVLEPSKSLSQVTCPVLAINGTKDLQVDADLNFPAIRKALEKAGNKQFELVKYDNLNHLFQECKTGAVSEYQNIEETFNLKPLKKMTEWIKKR